MCKILTSVVKHGKILMCCCFSRFLQPPKMRITEEKVSASLRDMHISSEYKPHSYCIENNASDMDVNEFFSKDIILLLIFFF